MPDWLTHQLIWFIVGMVLLISEFVIPGLVIGFFGLGALLTSLIVWLGWVENTGKEIFICAVASLVLLLTLRRFVSKWFIGFTSDKRDLGTPPDGVVGKLVEVIEKIEPNSPRGRVRLNGASWRAEADTEIEAGATVEIVAQDGLALKVKALDSAAGDSARGE